MPRKKNNKAPQEVDTNTATAVAELPAAATASTKRRKKTPVEPAALSPEPGKARKSSRRKKTDSETVVAESVPVEAALVGAELATTEPAAPPSAAVLTSTEPPLVQDQLETATNVPHEAAIEPCVAPLESRTSAVESNPAPAERINTAAEPATTAIASTAASVDPAATDAEPPSFDPTPMSHAETHRPRSRPMPDIKPDSPRFRSWSTRIDQGYEKLTDQKRGLLVLKFTKRPADEILDTLKAAGFQYAPDYENQGKTWLRRNDHEGRLQVEKIEMLLREIGEQQGAER